MKKRNNTPLTLLGSDLPIGIYPQRNERKRCFENASFIVCNKYRIPPPQKMIRIYPSSLILTIEL